MGVRQRWWLGGRGLQIVLGFQEEAAPCCWGSRSRSPRRSHQLVQGGLAEVSGGPLYAVDAGVEEATAGCHLEACGGGRGRHSLWASLVGKIQVSFGPWWGSRRGGDPGTAPGLHRLGRGPEPTRPQTPPPPRGWGRPVPAGGAGNTSFSRFGTWYRFEEPAEQVEVSWWGRGAPAAGYPSPLPPPGAPLHTPGWKRLTAGARGLTGWPLAGLQASRTEAVLHGGGRGVKGFGVLHGAADWPRRHRGGLPGEEAHSPLASVCLVAMAARSRAPVHRQGSGQGAGMGGGQAQGPVPRVLSHAAPGGPT